MAETILKVSLKEYKQQMDELKSTLLGLDSSSQEYKDTLSQLQEMQDKLNKVMSDAKGNNTALEGSYNALSAQLSELRKQWKATNDEATRNALAEQMNEINEKLKGFDASVGNYQRNVGNYANSFKDAFGQIGTTIGGFGGKAANAIGSVQGLGKAFTALKAATGWIGIVIGAAVALLSSLAKGISSNEKSMQRWEKVLTPVKALMDGFDAVLQVVADGFLTMVEYVEKGATAFLDFYDSIPDWVKWIINPIGQVVDVVIDATGAGDKYNEMLKVQNQIVETSNKLTEMKRDIVKENAELEAEEAAQMAIYSDRSKTVAEREKALHTAQEKRQQVAENNIKLIEKENELLKLQAINTENDAEMNDKLAESEAKLIKARAERDKITRQSNQENKQATEEFKRLKTEEFKIEQDIANAELNLIPKYTEEWVKKRNEIIQQGFEDSKKLLSDSTSSEYIKDEKIRQRKIATLQEQSLQQQQESYLIFYNERIKYVKQVFEEELQYFENVYGKESKMYNSSLNMMWEAIDGLINGEDLGRYGLQKLGQMDRDSIWDKIIDIMYSGDAKKFNEEIQRQFHSITDSFENQYTQFKKNFESHKFGGIEYNFDIDIARAKEPLKKLQLEYAKWDEILKEYISKIQKQGIVYIKTIDQIINYEPNVEEDPQWVRLITNLMLPNETFADFQVRLLNLKKMKDEAADALADYHNQIVDLQAENTQLENQIKTPIWKSTVWSDLVSDTQQAQIELDRVYKKDGESFEEFMHRKLIAEKNYTDAQKKLQKQQQKNMQDVSNATASILGDVANAWKTKLDAEVEAGEVSEEEAKKQFKGIKALQYGQTIISTLASVMQIMADSSIPSYWVKVPLAAAQLTAGLATAATIKNTEYGSTSSDASSSLSSAGVSTASVSPLLDSSVDINNMTSLMNQQDNTTNTRVYVLESDITDSQNDVRTKVTNSTF